MECTTRLIIRTLPIVAAAAILALPATGYSAVRYAKPAATGSGDCLSWADACALRTALIGGMNGDVIWVAAGTHKPTAGTDRTATFQLVSGVYVYGGFAGTETALEQRNWTTNDTVLSGDIGVSNDASDNSYHVVTGTYVTLLDGVTISGGYADGSAPHDSGGGMYSEAYLNLFLSNITFSGNVAIKGGGMFSYHDGPILTNVTFSGNSANYGGGMYNYYSSPALDGVIFSGNSAKYGGGMYNYSSNPKLTNTTFSYNTSTDGSGGGMYNNSSNPTLTNTSFSYNSASNYGAGIYNTSSSPTLTSVNFTANSATYGGGMYNINSNPTISNCIFVGDRESYKSGMYNYSSSPTVTNCTFTGNSIGYDGSGMINDINSNPIITNCTFSSSETFPYATGGAIRNSSNSNPTITNCILWGSEGWVDNNSSTSIVRNSIVQGGCPAGSSCIDIITADPLLGPLGYYGGSTRTFPLLPGSPTIAAVSTNCPPTDQRGISRSATCDIGAYESRGFTLAKNEEGPGMTFATQTFHSPLSVTLTESGGSPLPGATITFTAPTSGASLYVASFSVTTDSSGIASSGQITANNVIGFYNVTAAANAPDLNQIFGLANRGYRLGVSIIGEDGNKVESDIQDGWDTRIVCSSGSASSICVGEYVPGTEVILVAIPVWKSKFVSWDPSSLYDNSIQITLDSSIQKVSAYFDPLNRVRLVPVSGTPSDYNTMQGAYNQAADGDTIMAQGYAFPEVLPEIGKVLKFQGGYDGTFSDDPGMTTVTGPFTVKGSVTAERLVVKSP